MEDESDGVNSGPAHLPAVKDTNELKYKLGMMKIPMIHAMLQGTSSLMGLLFLLYFNTVTWVLAMVYSFAAFLYIFPSKQEEA